MANVYRDYNSRQDSSSYGFQIYVFKVEIDCCESCPVTLKQKLQDLDGIESVHIDEKRNLATVKATINSRKIIKKVKEWGKIAELVHERKETNANGYRVELIDDEDEEEKEEDDSFRHKNTSFRHKNSPHRHNNSSPHTRHKNNTKTHNTSTHAPEKYDYSEKNAHATKEVPNHICNDKYCKFHRRDNYGPNMNYSADYPPLFRGGLNYNYPRMSPFVPPPPMYGPPPPPPPPYGQYYDQEMVPPGPWYGGYAKHSNGCSIM